MPSSASPRSRRAGCAERREGGRGESREAGAPPPQPPPAAA